MRENKLWNYFILFYNIHVHIRPAPTRLLVTVARGVIIFIIALSRAPRPSSRTPANTDSITV